MNNHTKVLYMPYIHLYMWYKVVQAMINIKENSNRVINIVKAKYGLKDKSEVIDLVMTEYEEEFLEPQLRPEYLEKVKKLEKQKGIPFKDINELRKLIEG